MTNEDGISARIARFMLDHPKTMGAGLVVALVASCLLMLRFQFTDGIEAYFNRALPEQKQLDKVVARFVGEDVLVVAYRADDVFSKPNLESIRKLSGQFNRLSVEGDHGT